MGQRHPRPASADSVAWLRQLLSPLALLCTLLVVARAVDSVLYYRIAFILARYLWFMSSVVYPLMYCVAILPVVLYRYHRGYFGAETLKTPWAKFAVMAALDQSYNLMSTWPLTTIGGATANLLTQLALPVNLVLAAVLLGTRCEWCLQRVMKQESLPDYTEVFGRRRLICCRQLAPLVTCATLTPGVPLAPPFVQTAGSTTRGPRWRYWAASCRWCPPSSSRVGRAAALAMPAPRLTPCGWA